MPEHFPYNAETEDPPAPFLTLQVRHFNFPERAQAVSAKLDTGADISAIPEKFIRSLGLEAAERVRAIGFDGTGRDLVLYAAVITLPNGANIETNVGGIPVDYVLLSRDVLNQLRLLLDGPAQSLEILE